jgi:hypothetical protein
MPSGVTHIHFLVHLGIILILVLGVYSGLSGRVRTAYLVSPCIVSLASRAIAQAVSRWLPTAAARVRSRVWPS